VIDLGGSIGGSPGTCVDRCPVRRGAEVDDVNVARSLWASIQGDPVFMRRVNGWLTIFWIAMIPVSIVFGLLSSVSYVSALSLWALVSGHWSAWQAARVEVEQVAEAEELSSHPVEERVVAALLDRTNVEPSDSSAVLTPESPARFADMESRLVQISEQLVTLQSLLGHPGRSDRAGLATHGEPRPAGRTRGT
jgi:predicted transcriptional regulator